MNYRYHVKYGLRSDGQIHSIFIVCHPSMINMRAQIIVDAFYDNLVEQGVIFDNTIDYYVEQVRNELAKEHIQWAEEAIWSEAYTHYCTIKNYDVDFWDMWDMLISQCEMPNEDLVRIDFIEDGFLSMDENLDKEEFDYNCLFNLIIGTIRKECMAMDNWTGNEVYVEMNR